MPRALTVRFAVVLASLLSIAAYGQSVGPNQNSFVMGNATGGNQGYGTINAVGLFVNGVAVGAGGCSNNCTFTGTTTTAGIADTGGINTTNANGYQIGGVGALVLKNGYPAYQVGPSAEGGTPVFDLASINTTVRQNTSFATLIASAPLTNGQHWQQMFTSTTLQSGTFAYEIMPYYAGMTIDAAADMVDGHDMEFRLDNSGTIGEHDLLLLQPNNYVGGTAAFLEGLNYDLHNENTTAGAIAQVFVININPMTGGGSLPTTYRAWQNTEPNAGFFNISRAFFGGAATNTIASNVTFQVGGQTGVTFPFYVSTVGGTNIFNLKEDGTGGFMAGTLSMGNAFGAGSVTFFNGANGGEVNLSMQTASTTQINVKFPSLTVADTLAVLGTNQTLSAVETVSGTLNVTGALQSAGVPGLASKTCTINTANAATGITLTISNGIITGTTTC